MNKLILVGTSIVLCALLGACNKESVAPKTEPTTTETAAKKETTASDAGEQETETTSEPSVTLTNVTPEEATFMLQTIDKTKYDPFDWAIRLETTKQEDGSFAIGTYERGAGDDDEDIPLGDTVTYVNATLTEISVPRIDGKTTWRAALDPEVIVAYRLMKPALKGGDVLTYHGKQDMYIVIKESKADGNFVSYHIYNRNTGGIVTTTDKEDPFLYL